MDKVMISIVIVLSVAITANAEITSNSMVIDDIEYYIQADNSIYDLGQDVEILHRITNLGEEEWSITTLVPSMRIIVEEKVGEDFNPIWPWDWDIYPAHHIDFILQPEESAEISAIWPQIDQKGTGDISDDVQVSPGIYRLGGIFSSYSLPPIDDDISLSITIVPEPATICLVAFGFAGIILSRKQRDKK
jgi:hypothetical protein